MRSGCTRSTPGATARGDGSDWRACGGADDDVTTGGAAITVLRAASVDDVSGLLPRQLMASTTTPAATAQAAMPAIRPIPARGCDAREKVRGAATGEAGTLPAG